MNEEQLRDVFISQLKQKSLGPGFTGDLIVSKADFSDEILDTDPMHCYLTGVIIPSSSPGELESQPEDDKNDSSELERSLDGDDNNDRKQDPDKQSNESSSERNDVDFVPSDKFGLITCISRATSRMRLKVSYAKYRKLESAQIPASVYIKVGPHRDAIRQIFNINDNDNLNTYLRGLNLSTPLSSLFKFNDDENTISLNDGVVIPHDFDLTRLNRENLNSQSLIDANNKLKVLLRSVFFKRDEFVETVDLDVEKDSEFSLDNKLRCYVNVFDFHGRRYIKILLKNCNDGLPSYRNSIFQPELKLVAYEGDMFESYVDPVSVDNDLENQINEYMYRNLKNYGKGIGCALNWNDDATEVKTDFMPLCEVKKFSHGLSVEVCTLRNISIWSKWDDETIIDNLERFVDGYEKWHESERMKADCYLSAAQEIISKQKLLLTRMRDNVSYLRTHQEALQCFKIANTAMLIQMVISRDPNFKKNRDLNDCIANQTMLDDIAYFADAEYINNISNEPSYRPFQLAFLLINIRSTFEENDPDRTNNVDLIWFPTGGGKTEAYLALSALTIVNRRRSGFETGVSVIMRYTLRLLTTQQFERASLLICALEFLRRKEPILQLGKDEPISLGLWIGGTSSPNSLAKLNEAPYLQYLSNWDVKASPFPINYCPWCGCKLKDSVKKIHGYMGNGELECLNTKCEFHNHHLPIYYIDSNVYHEKPTLLFSTVDKFASLIKDDAAKMLGFDNGNRSPDLIIQDELHLISGPLGSIVGLFEMIVEQICSKDGHKPKVIASTATTRNTERLISHLYGGKSVSVFPAYGLSYTDNYFSHIDEDANRVHMGIMPTTHTNSNAAEIKLTANLLLSRAKMMELQLLDEGVDLSDNNQVYKAIQNDTFLKSEYDNYWSVVLYYNSLKDLGRSYSRASQEVYENYRSKKIYFQIPTSLDFICNNFDKRIQEFTSREDSSRIKELLTAAESQVELKQTNDSRIWPHGNKVMDLIYASNMISVGIDISRWNLMLMIGQPRSTSEYIQSSSRVARSHKGLVVNLFNSLRNREYSLFENYISFHQAYYKYVEPLSITPITAQTLSCDIFNNVIECYRKFILSPTDSQNVALITEKLNESLISSFKIEDPSMIDYIKSRIEHLCSDVIHQNVKFATSLRYVEEESYSSLDEIRY